MSSMIWKSNSTYTNYLIEFLFFKYDFDNQILTFFNNERNVSNN